MLAKFNYKKYATVSNKLDSHVSTENNSIETLAEILLAYLSFSHIRELLAIDDPLAHFFYETECMKGT